MSASDSIHPLVSFPTLCAFLLFSVYTNDDDTTLLQYIMHSSSEILLNCFISYIVFA